MKLIDIINEEQTVGHVRLVASIQNMLKKKGKKVGWKAIEKELKKIDGDEPFMRRIKAKAKKIGYDGYYWGAIRSRVASHFTSK